MPEKGKEKKNSSTNSQEEGSKTEKNLNGKTVSEEGLTVEKMKI